MLRRWYALVAADTKFGCELRALARQLAVQADQISPALFAHRQLLFCPLSVNFVSFMQPGHYYDSKVGKLEKWYNPQWHDEDFCPPDSLDLVRLREGLEAAVKRQLMSDGPCNRTTLPAGLRAVRTNQKTRAVKWISNSSVCSRYLSMCLALFVCVLSVPYGVLLSGGLDSSLIAAIAARVCATRVEDEGQSPAWWPRLHSFSVGLKDSPDLKAARVVADAIHTVHHEFHFTVEEGINALQDVIYHLET